MHIPAKGKELQSHGLKEKLWLSNKHNRPKAEVRWGALRRGLGLLAPKTQLTSSSEPL